MLLALLLLVGVLLLVLSLLKNRQHDKRVPHLPWVWPILGNIPTVIKNRSRLLDYFHEQHKKYNGYFYLTAPGVGTQLFVNDPESIQYILSKNFDNYPNPEIRKALGHEVWGDGIFMVNGYEWKRQRDLTKPIFKVSSLKEMLPMFQKHTNVMIDVLNKAKQKNEIIDIQELLKRFTLDVIGEIGFGTEIHSLTSPVEFSRLFDWVQDEVSLRFLYPFRKLTHYFLWKNNLKKMNDFVYKIVKERKTQSLENDPLDLLSQYLKISEEENLTDKFVRDGLMNFFIAGRDTTSILMTWYIYFMCKHPNVEKKVFEEIDEVFPDEFEPTLDNLKQLKYLRNVLDETLRLFPPALPIVGKVALQDDVLPSGIRVKAGQEVCYCNYSVHRDPKYWGDDVDSFNPDRWDTPLQHPFQFVPFQKGPRICLGMDMAYLEVKIVICMLYKAGIRFSLVENQKIQYFYHITLPAKYGIRVAGSGWGFTVQSKMASLFGQGRNELADFILGSIIASPLEIAKTQRQTQFALTHLVKNRLVKGHIPKYSGFMHPLIQSYKKLGIKALFRGFALFTAYNFANVVIIDTITEANSGSFNVLPLVFTIGIGYSTYPLLTARNQHIMMQYIPEGKVFPRVLRNGRMFAGVGPMLGASSITLINNFVGTQAAKGGDPLALSLAVFSMLTGTILIGYPLQTIAANQQILAISQPISFRDTARIIARSKGWRGFFAGGLMNIGTYFAYASSALATSYFLPGKQDKDTASLDSSLPEGFPGAQDTENK